MLCLCLGRQQSHPSNAVPETSVASHECGSLCGGDTSFLGDAPFWGSTYRIPTGACTRVGGSIWLNGGWRVHRDTIFLLAIREIGASHASAVGGLQPLTTLFFEWMLLRSPLSWSLFVGSCFVVLGVICLSRGPRQTSHASTCPKPRGSQSEYRLPC